MAFQEIKPLEDADFYLDVAFRKATQRSGVPALRRTSPLGRLKTIELIRITTVKDTLTGKLESILAAYPVIKDLTDFYKEIISATISMAKLNDALINVSWTSNMIKKLYKKYDGLIKKEKDMSHIQRHKKEFYGRVSSLMKKLNPSLTFLREAREILQSIPVIKTKMKQIAIAGFPNVGKSTLLSKISTSKPEIASYPFTTKKTMIGYIEEDRKKIIQLLDTPGTLNRFNKMNVIEQQAYLVQKMVANKIIFIFDLTEQYPIEDQEKLYKKIKAFEKPMLIYLSKTDILPKEKVEAFSKKYKVITDCKKLKELLI